LALAAFYCSLSTGTFARNGHRGLPNRTLVLNYRLVTIKRKYLTIAMRCSDPIISPMPDCGNQRYISSPLGGDD